MNTWVQSLSLCRVCSTCKEEIKASIYPCKTVVNVLIQLLLFSFSCLWYLSGLAGPRLLFWMLLKRMIICHLSCRKGPVVLSLRQEEVLLAIVSANWAKSPCFYYKISICPEEMQSFEIILFVSDELFHGLTAVTAVRNCPEKDMVIRSIIIHSYIWHKIDGLITICFLSPLKIIYGFFLKGLFDSWNFAK